jgi:hypothetical protein
MCRQTLGFLAFAICAVVFAVSRAAAADELEVVAKANAAAEAQAAVNETVNNKEMSNVLGKIERALQRIQRRAAGDGTLRQLTVLLLQMDEHRPHDLGWLDAIGLPRKQFLDYRFDLCRGCDQAQPLQPFEQTDVRILNLGHSLSGHRCRNWSAGIERIGFLSIPQLRRRTSRHKVCASSSKNGRLVDTS